jgi:hypothetical protein
MLLVLIFAAGLASGTTAASARTTSSFDAAFQETFGRATPTPCSHFLCGTGTVTGYGSATSILDITSFVPTSESCADISFVRTITLVADGSSLNLTETGVVCFPGSSFTSPGTQVSFGNPGTFTGSYSIKNGSGVFKAAKGTGVSSLMAAGDTGHSSLSGTISLT